MHVATWDKSSGTTSRKLCICSIYSIASKKQTPPTCILHFVAIFSIGVVATMSGQVEADQVLHRMSPHHAGAVHQLCHMALVAGDPGVPNKMDGLQLPGDARSSANMAESGNAGL